MYKHHIHIIRFLASLSLIVIASSCRDIATEPRSTMQNLVLKKNEQTIVGTHSILIPTDNLVANGSVSLQAIGIMVEANTSVIYRITGGVTVTTNPAAAACGASGPPPAPIVYAGGVNRGFEVALQAGVRVMTQSGLSNWIPFHQSPTDNTVWESDTIYINSGNQGELWVTRSGISGGCSVINGQGTTTYPQFNLSGSQVLTVTKYQNKLELAASPSFGVSGTTVTFTPRAVDGDSVYVQEWKWKPLGGSTVTVSCPTGWNAVCNRVTNETGTMSVKAEVDGRLEIANRWVDIVACVTGDSILDRKGIRDALTALLAASNPDSAPGTGKKRERGGLIYATGAGEFFFYETSDPLATECHFTPSAGPQPPPRPGATLVALVHTHPSVKGEIVYGCRSDANGTQYSQYPGDGYVVAIKDDEGQYGGGSPGDWDTANSSGYPVYTITKSGWAFRLNTGVPANQQANNTNRYQFKDNNSPTCNW